MSRPCELWSFFPCASISEVALDSVAVELVEYLRSTKWNASLILLRDYAELVALCKVIVWKTHIPVRTQKWPPLLIFAGARHGIVINYGHGQ